MGIVIKQSIKNTFVTYIGFAIGAANTLFLYPYFLGEDHLSLTNYILATGNILYPFMSFGIQNTLIKYFNQNKTKEELNGFMTLMLLIPLLLIIPIFSFGSVFYDNIATFEASKNAEIYPFVWLLPLIGLFIGYFEIFYAWLRAHMKSVFGGFVKEVLVRVLITIMLLCVYYNLISKDTFLYSLALVYFIALFIIIIMANKVNPIKFSLIFPENIKEILTYTCFIFLSASVANMLLDIDKYMISKLLQLKNIGYYSVAIFIAMVIAVPQRAMHQITYPITAKLLSENKMTELNELYKKSSITLQVIGGLIMLGIFVNINQLYLLLPPQFSKGIAVVFIIGLSKYFDVILGNNNAIIFNSKYYKAVLFQGLFIVFILVLLNLYLIPNYGINGAALATLIAIGLYSLIKLLFVVFKLKLFPFTNKTIVSVFITLALFLGFYFWEFPFHVVINIALKSVLVGSLYLFFHYYFKVSSDINFVIKKFLKIS